MKKRFLCTCLLLALSLYAKKAPINHFIEDDEDVDVQAPWLTGPLLAPSGLTIPPGHYSIEPYIYATANTGRYQSNWSVKERPTFWTNYFQPSIQVGLLNWLDFQINPTLYYNYTHHAAKWAPGDMPLGFDIQLYKSGEKVTDWIMGLKLSLKETVPIGKYSNLNPQKLGTDIGGGGSWQTSAVLTWGNLFYLTGVHFLTFRFAVEYSLPAPVHVKNLNVYGGGPGTDGTVYPAQNLTVDTAFELTLTQNWALALDIVGYWSGKTRFKGTTFYQNTSPPVVQFSLAPAIEYNWSADIGIIFGPWLTVTGRNSVQFESGVFAFNYYH